MPTRDAKDNILFIYHRLDGIGGIETRWIDEFKYLHKHNYQVYLLTNKRAFDPKVATLFDHCHFITVGITSVSLATDFIKLVDAIVDTIKSNDIHVLSIHMLDLFACAAVMAAQSGSPRPPGNGQNRSGLVSIRNARLWNQMASNAICSLR